ncbi:MAG: ATP-binding protein [Syntrophothermus sp.]
MFYRNILAELHDWAEKPGRKPLILRGARQVGKTTAVRLFSKGFDKFIALNLELKKERDLFEKNYIVSDLITAIHLYKNITKGGRTLLFIDEIQNSPEAVSMLRYFYEEAGDIYVIAAGSLLESLIDTNVNFPVGRVEYLRIHPCSFTEYLGALGENQSLSLLEQVPFPEYAHTKLYDLFHTYTLTGGMPEAISSYSEHHDLTKLNPIYDSLIVSYLDDVEKYAPNNTMINIIRHTIRNAFLAAGGRIKFQGFGNSNYKSREVGEAFRILEKTMLLQLLYPVSSFNLPMQPDTKKSPKLQVLDTGLINYLAGIQYELFDAENIDKVYNGKISEHIAGQEILSLNSSPLFKLNFWTREDKSTNAEVDFIWKYKNYLLPIEVKSGTTGRLRSLFEFIDRAPHQFAVRIYSGMLSIEKEKTIKGKEFILLNLPFYLINKIDKYIELMMEM